VVLLAGKRFVFRILDFAAGTRSTVEWQASDSAMRPVSIGCLTLMRPSVDKTPQQITVGVDAAIAQERPMYPSRIHEAALARNEQ
jgi:hypothetical protein